MQKNIMKEKEYIHEEEIELEVDFEDEIDFEDDYEDFEDFEEDFEEEDFEEEDFEEEDLENWDSEGGFEDNLEDTEGFEGELDEYVMEDDENIENEEGEESGSSIQSDMYGAIIDPEKAGLISGNNEEDDNIIDIKDSLLINSRGDLVVMDTEDIYGEYFRLEYVDISNIAVVKRIRKNRNVEDLVQSIRSTGLLNPVVVAPTATDNIYVLLAGYRRLLACAKVGIRSIPCIVNTKVNTPEIPILESIYNHNKSYNIKEVIEYIEYLEEEKNIKSPSMIEYLLQMENGDYTKLKDILTDGDDDIVSRLMDGQYSIGEAFRKLEQRRKKESREEKDIKRAEQAYEDTKETGAEAIEGSGEQSIDGEELTEEEIKSLAIMAGDIDNDDMSLEEAIEEGSQIDGYEPNQQSYTDRKPLDPALRKAVLARDNNTCKCCDVSGQEYIDVFDVHHIIEVYLGGSDAIENLITVCVRCHRLIHLYSRGDLHMRPIEQMGEDEQKQFRRIVKLGNIIRKGLAMKGMKREDLKKLDNLNTIGRTKPGTGQIAT